MTSAINAANPTTGTATTASVRTNFSAAADEINALQRMATDKVLTTGTSTAYVATFTNAPTLVEGLRITIEASVTNTSTTPTLDVNSTGATTIVQEDGTAIEVGNIVLGGYYDLIYDATATVWVLMNRTPADLDTELAAIASVTSAANKVPYFTGSGTASVLDFLDEDTMSSDSATAVASQQSVKAYADSLVPTAAFIPVAVGCFNGTGTPAWLSNTGFSSTIVDNGTGDYTLTLSTAQADANYTVQVSINRQDANTAGMVNYRGKTTTQFIINTTDNAGALTDATEISVTVWPT